MVGNDIKAENSNDVQKRLTENLGHQNMESISIVKPGKNAAKEDLPRKNMWLKMKQKQKTLMMSVKG